MTKLLERDGRTYSAFESDDDEVVGSEIVYLKPWSECRQTPAALEARLLELFEAATVRDETGVSTELKVAQRLFDVAQGSFVERCVATVYLFLTEDGVEVSGFALDDQESELIGDLEALLSL